DVVRYRALDPIVWLSHSKGVPKVLDELNIDQSKPIITIRPPEEFAAYLAERNLSITDKVTEVVSKISELIGQNGQIVVLPRYDVQLERFKRRFGNNVIVPNRIIDAVSLIRVSTVFLGGGGTMTAESSLLGVPAISYYPGDPTFVEKFLIHYGLVERILDPGRIAQRANGISRSAEFREFYQKKSTKLIRSMEDPLRTIIQRIFKQ
ncbi:MAG TPA: DUF354 domain-containing protein, partial [Terriglobales bacterium]|nr:DUF354 domain-containing protein [Terriglobales bacterium]